MSRGTSPRVLALLGFAGLAVWGLAVAFGGPAWSGIPPTPGGALPASVPWEWRGRFPNVPLQTHDGRTVRFYDDLLRGKIVTVNFFYIECDGICPGVTSNLVEVQRELGSKAGREVLSLCISLKPKDDSPEKLRDYARRYQAGPGMIFLTGKPEDVEVLRRALSFSTPGESARDPDPKQHQGLLRLGNEPFNWWTACPSQASAGQISRILHSLELPGSGTANPERVPPPEPLSNPSKVQDSLPGSADPLDQEALETLVENLDRIHMIRMRLTPEDYLDQVFAKMAQFLGLDSSGAAVLRSKLLSTLAEVTRARTRGEALRARSGYDAGDPGSVLRYRQEWRKYLSERSRSLAGLEGILGSSPRERLFGSQGARWLYYLEEHPEPPMMLPQEKR